VDIVDKVAEAIYRHEGGMTDSDFEQATGRIRRAWQSAKPGDADPERELCEWERDDYRMMARAAIQAMQQGKA
jgi:hypothetical protein